MWTTGTVAIVKCLAALWALSAWVTAVGFNISAGAAWRAILGDLNARLPPERRIDPLLPWWRWPEVVAEYARTRPGAPLVDRYRRGRRRAMMSAVLGFCGLALLSALW